MVLMKRYYEAGIFFAVLLFALFFQFRAELSQGHSLYMTIIEDQAARYSFFPWDIHSARQLNEGHFPLWNPYSGTGMPHIANLQSSVFMPIKWIYFLWPSPRALDLFVILRIALCGTFAFMLGRSMGYSRAGALTAGGCLALSGYMIKHMNVVNISSEMWLPLLFYFIYSQRKAARILPVIFSGVVWALALTGGNPEAGFYVTLLAALFALFNIEKGPGFMVRILSVLVVPFVLGGLVASIQGLPFVEYLGAGWHIHDPNMHKLAPFPAEHIWSFVAPWLGGPSGSHPSNLTNAPYIGALVLTLSLIAVLKGRKNPVSVLFFIGMAGLLLALVYRVPPLCYLSYVPPFNISGNAKFAMAGVVFCFAMLAGAGIDSLLSDNGRDRRTPMALAVVSILLMGGALYVRKNFGSIVTGGFVTPFAFLLAASFLIFLIRRFKAAHTENRIIKFKYILSALCVIELSLLFFGWTRKSEMLSEMIRFNDPSMPEALIPISDEDGHFRSTGIGGTLHPNLNMIYNIADVRSFEGIYPANYVGAFGKIEGFQMDRAIENFFSHGWMFDIRPENLSHPMVNKMGIKYVISKDRIKNGKFFFDKRRRL